MSSLRLIPQLLERNQEYAKSHTPLPLITEFPPGTRGPKTVIFSCCDGRVDPEAVLGLKPGEAIVLRNAGCNVPQNLEDLLLLDHVRGGVEEVLVLEHTDCGVTYATDEEIRESLKKLVPSHSKDIDAFEFGTFKNDLGSTSGRARKFVAFLKTSPFINKELAKNIVGAVYDIKTGKVTTI